LHRIKASHRAIQHAQRTLYLGREIHVTGRVDDVDANAVPCTGCSSRGDRDATLLLLLHPVHRRGPLVHFADTVIHTRIEENALGRRRLAGVDVSHNPDVPAFL
jgi:hypothetical protein